MMYIFRVTGLLWVDSIGRRWIPTEKPVTRSFDIFCDLRLNKALSKQSGHRRDRAHYDVSVMLMALLIYELGYKIHVK